MLYTVTAEHKWLVLTENAAVYIDAHFYGTNGCVMAFLASPGVVARQGYSSAGLLFADREFSVDPSHLTIVGRKDDPVARELFATGLRCAPPMSRLEWFDVREGPLPKQDVPYPTFADSVAFYCTNTSCSLPIRTPEKLQAKVTGSTH